MVICDVYILEGKPIPTTQSFNATSLLSLNNSMLRLLISSAELLCMHRSLCLILADSRRSHRDLRVNGRLRL
ncbi:hypothetical protein C1H46_020049 [Malus baccata]|uniref:Uncharacterized protein n=1 Tax=Malus baccata TaxID=106549 RepID=A0A540M6I2_MALBA|nr:hypothetical protein C1H46_020049 [Malus baccata]